MEIYNNTLGVSSTKIYVRPSELILPYLNTQMVVMEDGPLFCTILNSQTRPGPNTFLSSC